MHVSGGFTAVVPQVGLIHVCSAWSCSQYVCVCYLQWVLGADGQNLVLEIAELAAPGASLADPADEAGLMGTAH